MWPYSKGLSFHSFSCRWRLQKAFYSPESTGATGCSGITCQDVFPSCTCWEPSSESLNRPLTLDDLIGLPPEYICNVTVHEWRMKPSHKYGTKGPGKRGHIVADTLLPMMFLELRKLENICCRHKMFLNKIRNIFCVPDTKFVSATNVARAGKRRNICVGNNVSSFARALSIFIGELINS